MSKITLKHKLELPDGSKFVSRPGKIGFEAMMKLCEERLPWFNSRPGAQERRLRDKCHVEFVL